MTWTCPLDGIENPANQRVCLGGCGYTRIAHRVVLTSDETGRRLRMHITTAVGRSLLRTIGGSDVKYASEPQFEIVKDVAHGAWLLRHQPSARNPTYCDGIDVGSESLALVDGARLTIGRAKLRLTVNLEDG